MKKFFAVVAFLAMSHAACAQTPIITPLTGAVPVPSPAGQQALINGTPWVNGRGAIQGGNWRDNYQIIHDILNGMGTWDAQGNFAPNRVQNNAALAALPLTIGRVRREGFASSGDGGVADYSLSAVACTLNNGAGDGGAQVKLTNGGCANIDPSISLNEGIYGIDCTGAADSTIKAQALFTAATTLNMRVRPSQTNCVVKTTATITASGHIDFEGPGTEMTAGGNTLVADPQSIGPGFWFHFAHAGKGIVVQPVGGAGQGQLANYGNVLTGFGVYRDQPTPSATAGVAYAPCSCDFDVTVTGAEGTVRFDDLNGTKALSLVNAGKTKFSVHGQPLAIGVEALSNYDNLYGDILHFWTYWSNNPNVLSYMRSGTIGLHTGRADALHVHDIFCYDCWKGWDVDTFAGAGNGAYPGGTTFLASADRLYGDSTTFPIFFEPGVSTATIEIKEFISQPSTLAPNSAGVYMQGSQNTLDITQGFFDYSGTSHIASNGANNYIHVNKALVGSWNYGTTSGAPTNYYAFSGNATSPIVIDNFSYAVDVGTTGLNLFGNNSYKASLGGGMQPDVYPLVDGQGAFKPLTSCGSASPCPASSQIVLPMGRGRITSTVNAEGTICDWSYAAAIVTQGGTSTANCATAIGSGKLSLSWNGSAYVLTNSLASGTNNVYVGNMRVAPFN